jgi:hypothetical protein
MTDTTTVTRFSPALIQLGVNKLTTAADAAEAQRLFHDGLKRKKVDAGNIKLYRPDMIQIAFATMDKNHPKQDGMTMQQWLSSEDVKTRQGTFKSPFPKRDRKGKPLKSFYTKDAIQGLSRAYANRLKKDYLKDIAPEPERADNAEANYYRDTIKAVFPIVERIGATAFATQKQLDLQKLLRQAMELSVGIDKDAKALYATKKKKAEDGKK